MIFTSINIEGNSISSEIIAKISKDDISFQKSKDFGFDPKISLRDEIGDAWNNAKRYWDTLQLKREKLDKNDTGTSETRKVWMVPFLYELGYDLELGRAEIINEKSYAISHRDQQLDGFPVHIVGINQKLDKRAEHGVRLSPHGLMQEYLNNNEHLYGLVTNGLFIRVVRDATRLSRLSYLEFNLEQIMENDLYGEFAILYRLLHASRMPQKQDEGKDCIMEFYHQEAIASGTRIREALSSSVEKSIGIMANGLLRHRANTELLQQIENNTISTEEFQKQLLRLVYRLLFLLVIEERNLLYPSKPDEATTRLRNIYQKYYSVHRLTRLAQSRVYIDPRKTNLWQSLQATFKIFELEAHAKKLGLQALGSGIFQPGSLSTMEGALMNNEDLLRVLQHLTTIANEHGQLTVVNYADLDVEEFGSVYEGLLELHPKITKTESGQYQFHFTSGTERKETGSYYTNHDLVAQLIKSSLVPLVEERLKPVQSTPNKLATILDIKVCDPACGSGHFLLAAARKLATFYAQIATGEESPGKEPTMNAMRQVIQHCIYGVDKNPAAVELCKVALWIEGHSTGKPLSFLDHRIRPGDSLVGVDKLDRLKEGIPDGAFKETTGDDKSIAQGLKKQNKGERESKQTNLFFNRTDFDAATQLYAQGTKAIEALAGDTLDEIARQQKQFEAARANQGWWKNYTACNLYTYAFFQEYKEDKPLSQYVTSQYLANYLQSAGSLNAQLEGAAHSTAQHVRFFHWPLEFPEIAEKGGFDLMLANPPWERIKLQEKEFFSALNDDIANAPNAAARKRLIAALPKTKPHLHKAYHDALHESEAASKYIRDSNRYPLTGRGDINTYSIFAEVIKDGLNPKGRAGFIVPTGIATDDTNKFYFADLVENNRLESLYDFENRKKIFPTVDSRFKFSLLTIGDKSQTRKTQFGFFLHDVLDLQDAQRVFSLSKQDFLNINPNTKTTPIFRTRQDAELTAKIYSRVPVLINEEKNQNPWGVKFSTMFHMSNDSHLFRTREQMEEAGFVLKGNRFVKGEEIWLPLYESKMIWHYDHRFGSYAGVDSRTSTQTPTPCLAQYQDPNYMILPWYWISNIEVQNITKQKVLFGFRNVARATDERTFIGNLVPKAGVGNSMPVLFLASILTDSAILFAVMESIIFDFITRYKIAGTNLNFFYIQQLPALQFSATTHFRLNILKAFLELNYTSWDIKAFADDVWREADEELRNAITAQWEANKAATGGHTWQVPEWADAYPEIAWEKEKGCPLPPFKWDETRRAHLRAELDAYFALLYGLERDELRYILDPQDVYGPDFPGETFRVLKEKEIKKYGEYRTRRLVLASYDRLRPNWDMEAHLAKLKEIWEECQVDLSNKKKAAPKKAEKASPKPKEDLPARRDRGVQSSMFHETAISTATIKEGSTVTIKNQSGSEFHYIILRNAVKGQFTGVYKQISSSSPLAQAMLGKKRGERFEFGGGGYHITQTE